MSKMQGQTSRVVNCQADQTLMADSRIVESQAKSVPGDQSSSIRRQKQNPKTNWVQGM